MEKLLSTNTKCGWSINFPIKLTCRPTETCKKLCYARTGPITWPASIAHQRRVYQHFKETPYTQVAFELLEEVYKHKLSWIRWCGSGDLFPEAANVLRAAVSIDPAITHWVVTRKPEMTVCIPEQDNIYLMFSLDNTSSERFRHLQSLPKHKRLYFSYLRTQSTEDTSLASIIFNAKQIKSLPYDNKKKVCPADAGIIPIQDACSKCRKCFSPAVLRQM